MKKLVCMVLAVSVFCSGCASSTVINSVPSGATVYLDGQRLGVSPVSHSDTAPAGQGKTVILKKEGYKDSVGSIRKEEVKVAPIILGIFFLFPFIWMLGYPDSYTFELEPEGQQPQN